MSKSTPRRGFGRRGNTVTVIEAKVHRSSQRNARFAFIITALAVCWVTAVVATDNMHPILAFLLGLLVGTVAGAIVWALVRVWPVLRVIWWWALEIFAVILLMTGWIQLAQHTPLWVRAVVVGLVLLVPALVPPVRRQVVAWGWCVIVRHRLRVCFAQFIIANQSGSLPLILWAHPTPVGERVWVYLRPGLSVTDLQGRLEKIAVTCHADSVIVERANDRNSAYLRFDIKRRDVLTGRVVSPLVEQVDPTAPKVPKPAATMPTALDLPDVSEAVTLAGATKSATTTNGRKPSPTAAKSPDAGSSSTESGDDINDWI